MLEVIEQKVNGVDIIVANEESRDATKTATSKNRAQNSPEN